jgi:hypothetical protein
LRGFAIAVLFLAHLFFLWGGVGGRKGRKGRKGSRARGKMTNHTVGRAPKIDGRH